MADNLLAFDLKADDLCQRLGGGLPRGALVVMEGVVGAGKSVLCQRFTQGLLKAGTRVAYVSTELTTRGLLGQMESLAYDQVWTSIPTEKFVFIPIHPTIGERSARADRLGRLLKARRLYELDVIIFDTFTKLLGDHLLEHPEQALDMVESVLHLFKRLTGQGKTIVLTLDPDQAPRHVYEPFLGAADVYFKIDKERQGGTTSRRIVVERMSRAVRRYNENIGFRVEPRVGIIIEIRAVVG